MKRLVLLSVVVLVAVVSAETPAEREARLAARAAEKAATDAWRQLKKDADALVKKDFTGGFANYWHANIDAARELYETVFTNAVLRNQEKIDACREIAKCHLEATRDESAALDALDRAFRLPDLSDADRARAEKNRHEIKVLMRREAKTLEELEREKPRPRPPQKPKPRLETPKDLAFKDVNSARSAIKACRSYLASQGQETNTVMLAELLAEQARTLLKAGAEDDAREVWAVREKLVPSRKTSRLDCFWWKDAPHDVRGVLQSDVYAKTAKGLLVYPYGDNLKLLIETDAALRGRELTTDKGETFRPTELLAFCDDLGVKILLRSFGDMSAIRVGTARPSGYETYLATGIDEPYHCFMFAPVEGGTIDDGFVTQYDNGLGYRNLRDEKGTVRSESLYLDDGVATLISVPWTSVFASLPSQSPVWYFEAIHWDHGGRSFGGSISVHNRSAFGELAFTGVGSPELAAIKRRLLVTVKAKFGEALSARSNGPLERWADPELGDQEFFLAVVKPFREGLKSDVDRIGPTLADAEVSEIYDRIGETVLNIDYRVSRLRSDWLERRLSGTREEPRSR